MIKRKLSNIVFDAIKSGPVPALRDWRNLNVFDLTRGERVCKFIETHCIIPEGSKVGQKVVLEEFQEVFFLAVYDNRHVTDTAILSIARKNAKTGTIAFLVIAHLIGPEAVQNSRIVSGAMSRDQAAEVYNLAAKCLMLSQSLTDLVKIIPSSKTIIGLPMGTEYKATSADAKTAHGKSPIVAILDEVGQIKGPQSDFVDAITTAQAAYEDPLLIYISTQSATDADFFSIQIDDAERNKPKKTVCHVYCADKDADLLDEIQWRKANPALGSFRSMKDMIKQANKASRMPSFTSTFRNLNLNQRVSTVNPFVSLDVWKENGKEPEQFGDLIVYGGLDLSSRTDLTSLVLTARKDNGHLIVKPFFWTPEQGLRDRSKRDRVPYDLWVEQGFIRTTPGATVDYDYVACEIYDIIQDINLASVAFDRWRIDVFKKAMERHDINFDLTPFGQGFKDMSPAIDSLESDLLNARIQHGMNPVLTMCAANSVITKDSADGRKFDKHKATGRIDGMVALAMSVGLEGGFEHDNDGDIDDFIKGMIIV